MRILAILATAALMLGSAGATAHDVAQSDGGAVTPVFRQPIPNLPGKSLVSAIVDYAPGARSKPHHHAESGFAYVYVLAGSFRSQVGDEPVRVYRAGESFHEDPGDHHRVSENASDTEPAKILAVFVLDSDETTLTTFDK